MATYKLLSPVTHGQTTYTEITFRKPKARDLAAADMVTGSVKQGFAIIASMADVPLPVIMDLDLEDLEGAQEVAAPFMGRFAASQAALTLDEK